MLWPTLVAGTSLIAWIGLLLLRGGFWKLKPRLDATEGMPSRDQRPWPRVVAVVPARNEAAILPSTLPSVLGQTYPGSLHVILVDDRSTDATACVARSCGSASRGTSRLTVLPGMPLPSTWTGKVWAMAQGVKHAASEAPDFYWFTDADIAHEPGVLTSLVLRAVTEAKDLVSLMVQLRVDTFWDRLLIPAFVYFFAKLYPFRLVNADHRATAGAAGGCMLVRRTALDRAGGLVQIRAALIDDCALGRLIKRSGGHLHLAFTRTSRSVRRYGTLRSTWEMVARSAYTQLAYSPLLLGATGIGMLLLYAVPPATVIGAAIGAAIGVSGAWLWAALGAVAWGCMSLSFLPQLHHHNVHRRYGVLLPLAGLLYAAMTASSAWRYYLGRGVDWRSFDQDAPST